MAETKSYNPLEKKNLGKSVAEALLEQEVYSLEAISRFQGAGLYALYYRGKNPLYAPIAFANAAVFEMPIYVGKAIPAGGRKGANFDGAPKGSALFNRLNKHHASIKSVEKVSQSLRADDFYVRYLVVDDIWIPLGESLLISKYKPLWNVLIEGFGNNDPGRGRYDGLRPLWDHLHPGREWANKCAPRTETEEDVARRIAEFLG